jgi:hypothetical protein
MEEKDLLILLIMMQLTKIPTNKSSNTPISITIGIASIRSTPKIKTPFSNIRYPITRDSALYRVVRIINPIRIVAIDDGTIISLGLSGAKGRYFVKIKANMVESAPSMIDGRIPTNRSASFFISISLKALDIIRGIKTPLRKIAIIEPMIIENVNFSCTKTGSIPNKIPCTATVCITDRIRVVPSVNRFITRIITRIALRI